MTRSRATSYTPFFMVYSSEAILQIDLDYGVSKLGHTTNREPRYQQVCDVALLRSAKYQQALRWYHSRRVWGRAFNVGDRVLCLIQSNKSLHKLSLHYGRGRTSSRRCFGQAPTSLRPSMVRSSSIPRTSSNYVAFTLNKHTLSLISFTIASPIFSDT